MRKVMRIMSLFTVIGLLVLVVSCGKTPTPTPTPEPPTADVPTTPTEDKTPTADPTNPSTPTESTPTEEVELVDYSVIVKDIAGKPLNDFYVTFYLDNEIVAEGYTNNAGTFTESLLADIYDVEVEAREGYSLNIERFETDLIATPIEVEAQIEELSGIEAPKDNYYELGDVMYDFTVIDTEGNELTLYDLLDDYKAVLLNFWYTTCSACYYEFPYMVEAYESTVEGTNVKYSDEICIIAINPGTAGNGDTLADITNFKDGNGLSFNVAMDYDMDTTNHTTEPALTTMFGVNAYPTTVCIDSYGLIADIEVGAITATEKWTQTFDKYMSEDYVPVFTGDVAEDEYVKPNITQAESSVLEAAINGTNYDGTKFAGQYTPEDNDDAEFSWPWIVEEYKGKTTIKPSNKDIHPSFAIVYTTVHMKVGDVLTFDYYSSTEEYDALYVTANGVIATQISGQSPDWEKSYAYVSLIEEDVEFGFVYLKDGSYSSGQDAVYIANIRIVQEKDIDKETYIFREAATGEINELFMTYPHYATVVFNEEDGYYHVGTATGPLLFADMLSGTQWSNDSIYDISLEGKCIGADGKDYNGIIEEYSVYASNSSIGYTPVTEELASALKQVVKALGAEEAALNNNQWLEVCVYYSAYGTNGVELGLPTVGVCPFEPIEFEGTGIDTPATAEGVFDRIILPRGLIFSFTPSETGVYKLYTTEETLETYVWICDIYGEVIGEQEFGLRTFAANMSNGLPVDPNAVAYIYLVEGETCLFRAAFYDPYEYNTINVAMSYVADSIDLLTIASPGPFTTSDDEMTDIISGNYVNVELGEDGYYHVVGSRAEDDFIYCDIIYGNNITGYSIKDCLERFNAFDFTKDEYGKVICDENGYILYTLPDEEGNLTQYYYCTKGEEEFYVPSVGYEGMTEEAGYVYDKISAEDLENLNNLDFTAYVAKYIEDNMITDETSELYGCVKVDEKFASVLWKLMDKYTFAGIEGSWLKLCYYYKNVGQAIMM